MTNSLVTQQIAEKIESALTASYGITLLQNILKEEPAQAVLALLRTLTTTEQAGTAIAQAYGRAFNALAEAVNTESIIPGLHDAWQAYLITRLLDHAGPWSKLAEAGNVPAGLYTQARRDLRALQQLFDLTAETLWQATRAAITPSLPELRDAWVPWYDLASDIATGATPAARESLGQKLAHHPDWDELVDDLASYWARHGSGLFARYQVLRWEGQETGLYGIAHPDPTRLNNLIGYSREQALLRTNTERFLRGLPAHDAVLYGPPGTGKSSTVKALVNEYAEQGLRLIEVRKEQVNDLSAIVAQLRGRAPRFVLFVDDLSFEDRETSYKSLKVLLEGSAEARPQNVLIYVTTNRLNLIRENFSDRGKPADDVNWRDTMDEKNSLVARFGLRVTFATPDQEHYLTIVNELAQQRGLELEETELRERAMLWLRRHSGRSGRLARQFIDDLAAELAFN
jgi:predicted AAA+ superfamily ATPase